MQILHISKVLVEWSGCQFNLSWIQKFKIVWEHACTNISLRSWINFIVWQFQHLLELVARSSMSMISCSTIEIRFSHAEVLVPASTCCSVYGLWWRFLVFLNVFIRLAGLIKVFRYFGLIIRVQSTMFFLNDVDNGTHLHRLGINYDRMFVMMTAVLLRLTFVTFRHLICGACSSLG